MSYDIAWTPAPRNSLANIEDVYKLPSLQDMLALAAFRDEQYARQLQNRAAEMALRKREWTLRGEKDGRQADADAQPQSPSAPQPWQSRGPNPFTTPLGQLKSLVYYPDIDPPKYQTLLYDPAKDNSRMVPLNSTGTGRSGLPDAYEMTVSNGRAATPVSMKAGGGANQQKAVKARAGSTRVEDGLGSKLSDRFSALGDEYLGFLSRMAKGTNTPQDLYRPTLRTLGAVAGAAGDIMGAGVGAGLGLLGSGLQKINDFTMSPAVQKEAKDFWDKERATNYEGPLTPYVKQGWGTALDAYEKAKQKHPEQFQDTADIFNILASVPIGKAVQVAVKGTAAKTAKTLGRLEKAKGAETIPGKVLKESRKAAPSGAMVERAILHGQPVSAEDMSRYPQLLEKHKNDFVRTSKGSTDFGVIDNRVSPDLPTGPIRLQRGNEGFGEFHVEIRRGSLIREEGFPFSRDFIEDAVKGATQIWEQPNGRLLLVKKNGKNYVTVVEMQKAPEGDFYTVLTAMPTHDLKYAERKEAKRRLVYEGQPIGSLMGRK